MQKNIHPEYHKVTFSCSCGASHDANSTLGKADEIMKIEVCSKCHPSWVGGHKILDTEGRVDKFKNRFASFSKPKAKPVEAKPADSGDKK